MGGVSTSDAMYELISSITNCLNKGKKSIAVFLDLAKAFDTVPHEEILKILENYGVRGVVLDVFKSYLTNRRQKTKIKNSYSDPMDIKIGVPQGTVIGPILFITYMNSLLNMDTGGTIVSYADDTALHFEGSSWDEVQIKVKRGLFHVKGWLDSHKLTLNLQKTHYIAFSLTSINRPYFTSIAVENFEHSINEVEQTKYLGIIIDKHLRWENHIIKLTNNIKKLIYKFYLLREILSEKLLISVYRALVESLIRYGIMVWGGMCETVLKQLNVMQNTILKIIFKKNKRYSTSLLYSSDIFNVRSLYILSCCVYVHKEESMRNYINHLYNTRNKTGQNLRIPISHRSINQRFVSYLGPKFFNLLPLKIRNIDKTRKFNIKCRSYIFQNNAVFANIL